MAGSVCGFSCSPAGPPNDILLHVNMLDPANVLQQEAIGILGVNLIYAAFYEVQTKESFLGGLAQDVVSKRIEIDYVDLRGPAFESWDRRTVLVDLVGAGFAEAVFFPLQGLSRSPNRGSLQESRRACAGIFWPCGSSTLASSRSLIGFRYPGTSDGTRRNKLSHRWFFLHDSCTVDAERTGPGHSRLASSH